MPRVLRISLCARPPRLVALTCLTLLLATICTIHAREISRQRLTPVVQAVRDARPAVVSIQGQKIVTDPTAAGDASRQVNGMGTGTIVDERGYILTNYHVVSDVRRIEVTLDDGRGYTADLVAFDAEADLAIIKIPTTRRLATIRLGTSSDLMDGESVIALGNAYGYEQTVTRGIISALGRDVEVSDTQSYNDLIQTDASINPGNSGGPLLNIDGEMIGVNVAVRAGAQGIGFAIPIDDALKIATKLLNVQRLQSKWHGLVVRPAEEFGDPVQVARVESFSPAEEIGLKPGDEILQVGSLPITRPLDVERAFLDCATGKPLPVEVRRDGKCLKLELALAEDQVWHVFGLRLREESPASFQSRQSRYRGGMLVEAIRPGSPAEQQGIATGDILVGMHRWETASSEDVQYIVSRPDLGQIGKIKFYVLRGQKTLFGHMNIASATNSTAEVALRR